MMYQKFVVACLLAGVLCGVSCSGPSSEPGPIHIIPQPKTISTGEGQYKLKNNLKIGTGTPELEPAARYLQGILSKATGYTVTTMPGKGNITLSLGEFPGNKEAYILNITDKNIEITANSYGGIIYGIQSLRQLLPPQIESDEVVRSVSWSLPVVKITDAPRLAWRGLMLDVSRHFYSKEEVMELLDMMALYKLNKFHWHLTDDQGWRVEIKKYPLLTEKGAWRSFNSHDKECMRLAAAQDNPDFELAADKIKVVAGDTLYGGFYTQDEIREVVEYAAVRGIDVIPEIDMPGHFLAGVNNYTHLSCSDEPGWGAMFSSPICPGKDEALEFCKNVYSEVFGLFPYAYVHLGADEVEKTNWEKCPDCQQRMRDNGLQTEEELHAWFVKHMEQFFIAHGKHLIGWDEIVDGGLSPTATIMWWRNWSPQAVPTATAQGNQAIIAPNFTLYFDAQQDKKTLRNVYEFEPVMTDLSPQQQALILGVQANVWCEWIPSAARMQYMIMPRLTALSEIGWVEPASKNWDQFRLKMLAHLPRLDVMGVNYRIPDLEGFHATNAFIGEGMADISCPAPGVEIRYTTDGSIPTAESARYTQPIRLTETTDFTFRTFRPDGTKGDIVQTRYIKSQLSPAIDTAIKGSGLQATWHDYKGNSCLEIKDAPLKGEYNISQVGIPAEVKGNIGLDINGYFDAPQDGIYTFALLSDDGSILYIDGEEVINNDGAHSPREVIGQKALAKGLHPIRILYFDHNGGKLQLQSVDENGQTKPFATSIFKH